jgi:hypothetical protein
MMYDQNGNAQVVTQARATKDYTPAQLGLNAVSLPGSGNRVGSWVEVRGYSRISAIVVADQTFQFYIHLANDASGVGAAIVVATGSGLAANGFQIACNQGQCATGTVGSDKAAMGGAWNYARIVVINATANAATTTGYMHLQA